MSKNRGLEGFFATAVKKENLAVQQGVDHRCTMLNLRNEIYIYIRVQFILPTMIAITLLAAIYYKASLTWTRERSCSQSLQPSNNDDRSHWRLIKRAQSFNDEAGMLYPETLKMNPR